MEDQQIDAITFQVHRDYIAGRNVWREEYWTGYSSEQRVTVMRIHF